MCSYFIKVFLSSFEWNCCATCWHQVENVNPFIYVKYLHICVKVYHVVECLNKLCGTLELGLWVRHNNRKNLAYTNDRLASLNCFKVRKMKAKPPFQWEVVLLFLPISKMPKILSEDGTNSWLIPHHTKHQQVLNEIIKTCLPSSARLRSTSVKPGLESPSGEGISRSSCKPFFLGVSCGPEVPSWNDKQMHLNIYFYIQYM